MLVERQRPKREDQCSLSLVFDPTESDLTVIRGQVRSIYFIIRANHVPSRLILRTGMELRYQMTNAIF